MLDTSIRAHSSPVVRKVIDALASLRQIPIEQARTAPPEYYTSNDFMELEKEKIFRKGWFCVGHEGEIPNPGDYFATDLVDEQLLVVRQQAGDVSVLSNVCRHRGNVVARGSGNASRFTCAYHAWSYGVDGRLRAAPRMDRVDKSIARLPSFAVERWRGFIFVNLDGQAKPLGPSLADMDTLLRNYHPEDRHFLYATEDTWATNWKCLVENFMEGYHLSTTHSKTLHAITPTSLCEKLPAGDAFTAYRSHFHPTCPQRGSYHPDLSPMERRSDVFCCIYPSFVVGIAPHFTAYMCLRPLAANSVGIRWGITGVTDNKEADEVKQTMQLLRNVYAEDRAVLESLQKGLMSRYYDHGPLAPENFEGTIWDMLRYMAKRLCPGTGTC